MKDQDVKKLRMWLSSATVEAAGVRADLVVEMIRKCLAILPPVPKPAAKPMDVDVEKLRAEMLDMKVEAIKRADYPSAATLRDCIALLPPEPEVPEGPYRVDEAIHEERWIVRDHSGNSICCVDDELTAKLLASSWTLRRRLDAAEHLLMDIKGWLDGDVMRDIGNPEVLDWLKRHFEEDGA